MDFSETRNQYFELRKKERDKISSFLRKHDDLKKAGIVVKAKCGAAHYKSGERLIKEYDLSNWLWIDIILNGINLLLSLQTFDYDSNTGNLHVLMDRIGIYAYGGDYSAIDARHNMMITNIELPISEKELYDLADIIMDLSNCDIYKMQSQLTIIKNTNKLI